MVLEVFHAIWVAIKFNIASPLMETLPILKSLVQWAFNKFTGKILTLSL